MGLYATKHLSVPVFFLFFFFGGWGGGLVVVFFFFFEMAISVLLPYSGAAKQADFLILKYQVNRG